MYLLVSFILLFPVYAIKLDLVLTAIDQNWSIWFLKLPHCQYHLLHAKRYLGASVASSIKHYYHHHHWHHHQKAPSLPPALTTTRCYSPSVSLSPSSKKKKKEKTFLPLPPGIGILFLFVSSSLSLFPALALFPEISTICTFTPSPSLLPRPFYCFCTILVFVARMQKACSFFPTLKLSPFRPSHPSCPLRLHRHHRQLRCGHPLLDMRLVLPLAYHVVTTCVDCCLHTHNLKL